MYNTDKELLSVSSWNLTRHIELCITVTVCIPKDHQVPASIVPRLPSIPKDQVPVCFGFWQLLATKSCCGLPNTQLFSQLL
jgi:hypothetical protein